jgi:hypothetical protein
MTLCIEVFNHIGEKPFHYFLGTSYSSIVDDDGGARMPGTGGAPFHCLFRMPLAQGEGATGKGT